MGRTAAYHVRLDDGKEVGFGLVVRDASATYSVQFRDLDGARYVIRSTGERSRPRAITAAERIIRDHYRPPEQSSTRRTTWEELLTQLEEHLRADGARPATISDYLDTIRQVRSAAVAPAALSAGLAQLWCNEYLTGTFTRTKKPGAKAYKRSPRTLHARVRKLRAMWGKYLVKRLRVAEDNPWDAVELPKLDALPIRTLTADQVTAFFDWLRNRWHGWELPTLFFETKAVTGCRMGDLCGVRSKDLRDGKLYFTAETTKGRRQRVAVLPADLYQSLKKLAGRIYLWESYPTRLGEYLKRRGVPTHRIVPKFDPQRLAWWAKDEVDDFNREHPESPRMKSHDFRKRAVTEAHRAGLDVDTAAAAVGMSPATARAYYLSIDQERAAATLTARLADTLRPGKASAAKAE